MSFLERPCCVRRTTCPIVGATACESGRFDRAQHWLVGARRVRVDADSSRRSMPEWDTPHRVWRMPTRSARDLGCRQPLSSSRQRHRDRSQVHTEPIASSNGSRRPPTAKNSLSASGAHKETFERSASTSAHRRVDAPLHLARSRANLLGQSRQLAAVSAQPAAAGLADSCPGGVCVATSSKARDR